MSLKVTMRESHLINTINRSVLPLSALNQACEKSLIGLTHRRAPID